MGERYEIKSRIGRGGMSAIYEAYDRVMERSVAIKRLLPLEKTKLNDEASGTLQREALALSKFQHPNVVTIFDVEEDSDGPFAVMELIDGQDLHQMISGGALSVEDFESVAEQCLEPL
ncbi:MAG: protein kinase, partial [Verrucomicrobiota bacterium]